MSVLYIHLVLCMYFSCRNVQSILGVAGTDGCAFIIVVYGLLLHLIKKNYTNMLLKKINFLFKNVKWEFS